MIKQSSSLFLLDLLGRIQILAFPVAGAAATLPSLWNTNDDEDNPSDSALNNFFW
jgi:hypothetical protein